MAPRMIVGLTLVLNFLSGACGFTPPTQAAFATFGNSLSRELLKKWQPKPVGTDSGEVMLPSSTENMKRFVRARILLEDPSTGCVATCDEKDDGGALCIILTPFSKAEHQMLLPLWQSSCEPTHALKELVGWHQGRFGEDGTRLSGAQLEWPDDRAAWAQVCRDMDI